MLCPTYPRSGRRWGFDGGLSPELVPRVWAFATQISILFHADVISEIISGGFVTWKLSPGVGNLGEFVIKHLQIPTNPHLCLTWGRWGLILIVA